TARRDAPGAPRRKPRGARRGTRLPVLLPPDCIPRRCHLVRSNPDRPNSFIHPHFSEQRGWSRLAFAFSRKGEWTPLPCHCPSYQNGVKNRQGNRLAPSFPARPRQTLPPATRRLVTALVWQKAFLRHPFHHRLGPEQNETDHRQI